jgi:hypothetical protein
MSTQAALVAAERLLPAPDGTEDPRWQAIIEVGLFAKQEPEAIWPFVMKWGSHEDTSWNIILICYFHGSRPLQKQTSGLQGLQRSVGNSVKLQSRREPQDSINYAPRFAQGLFSFRDQPIWTCCQTLRCALYLLE